MAPPDRPMKMLAVDGSEGESEEVREREFVIVAL